MRVLTTEKVRVKENVLELDGGDVQCVPEITES